MSTLKQAAQDVIDCVDSPYIPDEIRMVDVERIKALREALQAEPEFNPTSLFKTADGHMSVDGYCVSFKDGNVVGVSAMTTPPSVDALIAEIDGLRRHGDDNYIYGFDIDPILDKYRSVK